jgi:hypothetical protein
MVCTAPMAYDKVYYTVTGVRGKMVGVMQESVMVKCMILHFLSW